ncbi:MAG: flagellar basal body-associated FliL family protein [Planctomycetota bacterium]
MTPILPTTQRPAAATLAAFSLALAPSMVGCYDGDGLVEKVRNRAIRTRLEEIAIGDFRVTLPRDPTTGDMTEVELRVFGESQRYKLNEIEAALADKAPVIEDHVVRSLREAEHDELVEPNLTRLRQRLTTTVNELLEDDPLVTVGFYDIRFVRH